MEAVSHRTSADNPNAGRLAADRGAWHDPAGGRVSQRPLDLAPGRAEAFPPARAIHPTADGLVALGGDLSPQTLLEAYRKGIFPWEGDDPVPWFSPDPRCILRPGDFHRSRSMRKLDRRGAFRVTADLRFREVMRSCASIHRPGQRGTWISDRMVEAYDTLYAMGIGHSVEVWEGDRIVGGLYGLAIGRAFFGESMFSQASNASKFALMRLCRTLDRWGFHFVDCQQHTPHLESLGAVTVPRLDYLDLLDEALAAPDQWNPDGAALLVL
jgi:leucyl/phenylalanyl-tRNA---protein transferase